MPLLRDALAVKLGATDVGAMYARGEQVWPTGPTINPIASIVLISINVNTATYECRDAAGVITPSQETILIETFNPATGDFDHVASQQANNGILTIINPSERCITYKPYLTTGVEGDWAGLPITGGIIYTASTPFTNLYAGVVNGNTDVFDSYTSTSNAFNGAVTSNKLAVGPDWEFDTIPIAVTAYPFTQTPDPITMGSWSGTPGSFWNPGLGLPPFLHKWLSAPVSGAAATNSIYLGTAGGDFFIPDSTGVQWLHCKDNADTFWTSTPGLQTRQAISKWGFANCVWTPPA